MIVQQASSYSHLSWQEENVHLSPPGPIAGLYNPSTHFTPTMTPRSGFLSRALCFSYWAPGHLHGQRVGSGGGSGGLDWASRLPSRGVLSSYISMPLFRQLGEASPKLQCVRSLLLQVTTNLGHQQCPFITSQFLWVRSLGTVWLDLLLRVQRIQVGCKLGWVLIWGLYWRKPASEFTEVVSSTNPGGYATQGSGLLLGAMLSS